MKLYIIPILILSLSSLKGEEVEAYAQINSAMTQRPAKIVGSLFIAENIAANKNFDFSPNNDFLICKIGGIYFVSASIQPAALNLGINGHLDAWFELNHKPISASCSRTYVTEKSPISVMTIPFIIELKPGDTLGTRFAASNPEIGITYIAAPSSIEPSVPSYTLSIYKVNK